MLLRVPAFFGLGLTAGSGSRAGNGCIRTLGSICNRSKAPLVAAESPICPAGISARFASCGAAEISDSLGAAIGCLGGQIFSLLIMGHALGREKRPVLWLKLDRALEERERIVVTAHRNQGLAILPQHPSVVRRQEHEL